jgi:hypothetical protein
LQGAQFLFIKIELVEDVSKARDHHLRDAYGVLYLFERCGVLFFLIGAEGLYDGFLDVVGIKCGHIHHANHAQNSYAFLLLAYCGFDPKLLQWRQFPPQKKHL